MFMEERRASGVTGVTTGWVCVWSSRDRPGIGCQSIVAQNETQRTSALRSSRLVRSAGQLLSIQSNPNHVLTEDLLHVRSVGYRLASIASKVLPKVFSVCLKMFCFDWRFKSENYF